MNKLTIFECFVRLGIPESKIERFVVKDNYVEYRIWEPCSISYNGRYFIKDQDAEFWTEDYEFYKQQTGVEPSEIDWSKQKEIKHPRI